MTLIECLSKNRFSILLVTALLIYIYYKVIYGMFIVWSNDDNYSHGYFIPLISGYFTWRAWPALKDSIIAPSIFGFIIFLIGILQLLIGSFCIEYFTIRTSLITVTFGIFSFLFGNKIVNIVVFPLNYLFFMIPIPYIAYDLIAFPLKQLATKVSVLIFRVFDISILNEGSKIIFSNATLEVADACSGLRSVMTLFALTTAYSFIISMPLSSRILLTLSAIPTAVFLNIMRIAISGVLVNQFGETAISGAFHEIAGILTFIFAIIITAAIASFLLYLPTQKSIKS